MQGFFADEREAQDTVETLNVDLGERSYPIFIGPGLLKETDRLRSHLGQGQAVIISNDTVAPLYLDQVKQTVVSIPGGITTDVRWLLCCV